AKATDPAHRLSNGARPAAVPVAYLGARQFGGRRRRRARRRRARRRDPRRRDRRRHRRPRGRHRVAAQEEQEAV
ncbi:MAG: hypothetical protein AVDCRST_MAG64-4207, partial [uncultured Phycisphaerae bacterium]